MVTPIVTRKPWGVICLVMNILLPGTGSMIAGGNQEDIKYYIYGVVQLVLLWTLVAWAWSIVMGILIFLRSEPAEALEKGKGASSS